MDGGQEQHIAHCSSCGCKMDISEMEPYTNVVCPDCEHHTRVKCELGPYLLTGRHAVGGMSMVFRARDVTLNREVAIKILNEEYSRDEKRMREFEREAMITAAITHPHVVRVFTVGKAYGHFYIAMEMVPGENLEQRISREDAIGEDVMLPIAAEIISGLRAAKQAGLIHRDMKPGNILFDSMGHVKIVDFGLALVTQGGKAKAKEVWATPYYVPPEALDGEEEDFRSDVYALGATLYHALSGTPPISDEKKSTRAVRKAKESIPPLCEVAPWLKPETCHMVDKAMALQPTDRFDSYADMEEAWNAAYKAMGGGGAADPIHSRERARRRVKTNRPWLSLIISSVVALVLVSAAVAIYLNKPKIDDIPEQEELIVDAENDTAEEVIDDTAGYDPEVAARIARQFRVSHQMLREKKYDDAKELFVSLMKDKDVQEPTASWAGVEAVIATWLGGNSGDASASIAEVQKHMRERQATGDTRVGELGEQLAVTGIIRNVSVGQDSMEVVYCMAVALKNWEMGAWAEAVPIFQKVKEHRLAAGSPLLVYRDLAQRYLSDYARLKPLSEMALPGDIDSARARLGMLKDTLGSLQTRGRARFHIRVWQIRLHRHIKVLRELAKKAGEEAERAPNYAEVLPKFHAFIAEAQYTEASEILQDVTLEDHQEDARDAWVYLADSASAFLDGLEEVIPETAVAMKIDAVDGQGYQSMVGAKDGGIQVMGANGVVFLKWHEIKPDSVLLIHQKAFKQTLTTLEGQLRTEQAVCYLWLVGLKGKAGLAATRLAEVNKDFSKRWENTMESQPQEQ